MPAKDLSKVGLTKADNQKAKVYKLRGELSKAQQKTFKVNQQQLTAAKRILSVQDTLNVQLGKDQVLKDENLKVQDLNTDFTYLKKNKAIFAKTIQGKIELLNNEVKAVSLIKAAVSGDPDQAKIDQARDAINAVNVKAFKEKYLPQLDEAIKKLPKDQQTEQAKKQAAAGDPQQASIAQAAASSSSSVTAASSQGTTQAAAANNTTSTGDGAQNSAGGSSNSSASNNGGSAVQPSSSKVLGVQFISQEAAGAPMGCEAASALEALHYKGHAVGHNLATFLKTMPIAANGNPYQGFGGTPYAVVDGVYQSIFPSAFTP